jgi:hypothetical protein
MSANILFINEATLKSRTGISDLVDGKQLRPQIKIAQDTLLQPCLGSTLYLRLQSGVEANNLSVTEVSLIDNYITDCLVWYTMSLLPFALGYQFFSKGVLQKNDEGSNTPSRADLELISNQYKQTAEFYKQRIINYLRQNYTLYAEYLSPGAGWDVIFPELKAYTSPIYLGTEGLGYKSSANNAISGAMNTVQMRATIGATSFVITGIPTSSVIVIAVRSGQVKGMTNAATTNTEYLQLNGTTVTLPTGDTVQDAGGGVGELFSFTYR